jgi:hypothetical protein
LRLSGEALHLAECHDGGKGLGALALLGAGPGGLALLVLRLALVQQPGPGTSFRSVALLCSYVINYEGHFISFFSG